MDDAPLTIELTRIEGGRTWIATCGRACGLGPTAAIAVEELLRWRASARVATAAPPGGEA